MPTGYTAKIAEGMQFKEYAMACARAFGALITMRDEPTDAPIPPRFEPSDFYAKCLEVEKLELDRLCALTSNQAEAEAMESHMKACLAYEERIARAATLRAKYEGVLADVEAWEPPSSEHEDFKQFMAKQIKESIKWDCDTSGDYAPDRPHTDEWLRSRIADMREQIKRDEIRNLGEISGTAEKNRWVQQLRDSLQAVQS